MPCLQALMFTMVKTPSKFEGWLDAMEQACNMTDRNLHKELMKKSSGAIRETISMMSTAWTDDDVISKLRQDFSLMSTMNRAREELKRPQAVTRSAHKLLYVQIW